MLKLLIVFQKGTVKAHIPGGHKGLIICQLLVQNQLLLFDLLNQPDHGAVIRRHDMGQSQTVQIHHRLFDLVQPGLADHIFIRDGPCVAVHVVDAEHSQDIGQHHDRSQQKDRQDQTLLQR